MIRQFVSFRLGSTLFGADVLLVREIGRRVAITPVSPAPSFVLGVMNLRGQIVPVVDPGVLLELAPRPMNAMVPCVVLKTDAEVAPLRSAGQTRERAPTEPVGFLVDEVGDLVTVDEKDIAPVPVNVTGAVARYVSGVVRLESALLAVLQVGDMIESVPKSAPAGRCRVAAAVSGRKENG